MLLRGSAGSAARSRPAAGPYTSALLLPRLLHPFHECPDRFVQRRRHSVLAPEADDTAVEIVDLRRATRFDVLEHRRLMAVGDLRLRRVVDQIFGVCIEDDPLCSGDRL